MIDDHTSSLCLAFIPWCLVTTTITAWIANTKGLKEVLKQKIKVLDFCIAMEVSLTSPYVELPMRVYTLPHCRGPCLSIWPSQCESNIIHCLSKILLECTYERTSNLFQRTSCHFWKIY